MSWPVVVALPAFFAVGILIGIMVGASLQAYWNRKMLWRNVELWDENTTDE